jgi:Tfp pilus assembly protein PilF
VNDIPPLARQALELAKGGDTDAALEVAERAIVRDPDDCGLRLFTATLYSRKLQLEKALAARSQGDGAGAG